ncbi:3-oxoacyl-[acyl-carrier protein] reductase [Acidisarcina polymorpha]|uniref:3-oxoacyl-[acyl-carrier protein] reductase n=1 Tax=Acidisarcina polymorpha TaxID=2211140 RepID=A0A2Z5G1Y9_9BACT|nr:SDR family oxidoreductase [Acidisarcina polymorpha]AXC13099.1 3-oxoacyl-[acyl-carrier protein] reductase [Acidisarcina polymorpha]
METVSQGVSLSLSGKSALVTGGSRGIGGEIVRLFRAAGAKVAFNYRTARRQAETLAGECGQDCLAIEQELASPQQGGELVAKAVAGFGRLDILVVNHGIWPPEDAPISSMSDSQWRRTMDVNLDSVFGLVKAATAQMKTQSRASSQPAGHIVLVSSTAGQRGEAFHADYAVTKGAIVSLTKSLSSELAPEGIYVNCVAPGWVETDMSTPALDDPARRAKIFSGIPLGRVATPREIAGPVLFLCTPLAGFISGEIFNVNGGAVLVG